MNAKEFTTKLWDTEARYQGTKPGRLPDHLFCLSVQLDTLLTAACTVEAVQFYYGKYDIVAVREVLISQLMEFFESEIRKAIERDYGPNALGKTSDIPEQCPPGPSEETG